jgi:hypothetical protein
MDDFTVVHDDSIVITKERYNELIETEKNFNRITDELKSLDEIFDFFGDKEND